MDHTKIRIIHNCSSIKDTSRDELFFVTRKLSAIENVDSAKAGIEPLTGKDDEIHLISQYEDEISEMKRAI